MIYNANNLYSAEQIAGLAAHLNATVPADLVRLKPKPTGQRQPGQGCRHSRTRWRTGEGRRRRDHRKGALVGRPTAAAGAP